MRDGLFSFLFLFLQMSPDMVVFREEKCSCDGPDSSFVIDQTRAALLHPPCPHPPTHRSFELQLPFYNRKTGVLPGCEACFKPKRNVVMGILCRSSIRPN